MRTIEKEKVIKVYSGKPGCMCGCRGKYKVASAHKERADRERGYPYCKGDISDKEVTRIVGILNSCSATKVDSMPGLDIYYLDTPTRVYAAYAIK